MDKIDCPCRSCAAYVVLNGDGTVKKHRMKLWTKRLGMACPASGKTPEAYRIETGATP